MDRPEQRQVIAAMPGGYGFALLRQGRDTALLRQELPDVTPECRIGVLRLLGFQHLAEDANQVFLDPSMLVVKGIELFLGRGLCSLDAAQQHLDRGGRFQTNSDPAPLVRLYGEQFRRGPARKRRFRVLPPLPITTLSKFG
jgi:hypothetical protein